MGNKRASRSKPSADQEPIVLGTQFAAALDAERQRLKKGGKAASPLPRGGYRASSWEMGLLRPQLNRYDLALRTFAQRFAASDADARAQMRAAISMNQLYTLLTFGQRAAVFALRDRDEAWVRDGLAAVAAIELERIDWRDIYRPIGLLDHAARRIGADAVRLFRDAAALAEPAVARTLRRHVRRPVKDRGIEHGWGHVEVELPTGAGFMELGFGPYSPSINLAQLAIDIADYLATDKYRPSVEIASELPPVWLEGVDDAKLCRALKKVTAGATIRGNLRKKYNRHHDDQLFLVFLAELRDTTSAEALLDLSRRKLFRDTWVLGVRAEALFALVVARSWVVGVKTYETKASIRRFEQPLQQLLDRYANR